MFDDSKIMTHEFGKWHQCKPPIRKYKKKLFIFYTQNNLLRLHLHAKSSQKPSFHACFGTKYSMLYTSLLFCDKYAFFFSHTFSYSYSLTFEFLFPMFVFFPSFSFLQNPLLNGGLPPSYKNNNSTIIFY
jgi:hypothetical protein